jgi:hypothetical protein
MLTVPKLSICYLIPLRMTRDSANVTQQKCHIFTLHKVSESHYEYHKTFIHPQRLVITRETMYIQT